MESDTYTKDEIAESEYFAKHTLGNEDDPRVLSLDLGPRASRSAMEDSMNESLKPNHFEGMDENQQVNP